MREHKLKNIVENTLRQHQVFGSNCSCGIQTLNGEEHQAEEIINAAEMRPQYRTVTELDIDYWDDLQDEESNLQNALAYAQEQIKDMGDDIDVTRIPIVEVSFHTPWSEV